MKKVKEIIKILKYQNNKNKLYVSWKEKINKRK